MSMLTGVRLGEADLEELLFSCEAPALIPRDNRTLTRRRFLHHRHTPVSRDILSPSQGQTAKPEAAVTPFPPPNSEASLGELLARRLLPPPFPLFSTICKMQVGVNAIFLIFHSL